jgi:hypothetical protein
MIPAFFLSMIVAVVEYEEEEVKTILNDWVIIL